MVVQLASFSYMCMLNDTDDDNDFTCDLTEELEQPTNFESSNSAEDCRAG